MTPSCNSVFLRCSTAAFTEVKHQNTSSTAVFKAFKPVHLEYFTYNHYPINQWTNYSVEHSLHSQMIDGFLL